MRKPLYTIEVYSDPAGGFVATIPELPGCITQAETEEELMQMILDAKTCWLEVWEEDLRKPYSPECNLCEPEPCRRDTNDNCKGHNQSRGEAAGGTDRADREIPPQKD